MKVLIIADDRPTRNKVSSLLEEGEHESVLVGSGTHGLQHAGNARFDIVYLDFHADSIDEPNLVNRLKEVDPDLSIIVTAQPPIATEALRRGATTALPKPYKIEQLKSAFEEVMEMRVKKTGEAEESLFEPCGEDNLCHVTAELDRHLMNHAGLTKPKPHALKRENTFADWFTSDPQMIKSLNILSRAANTPVPILLLGGSGTGKSTLAKAIHKSTHLRQQPFVTINCPSLSRDLLENELFGHMKGAFTGAICDTWGKVAAAEGGTLFLDEIGELPLELQPKLLRLLQDKEYERIGENKTRKANLRIMAATNRNLEEDVRAGNFREDLYYRLNVISVIVPSLSQRHSDIPAKAMEFLTEMGRQIKRTYKGFTPEAMKALLSYSWPGNIRELKNVIQRAAILAEGEYIKAEDLTLKIIGNDHQNVPQVGSSITLESLEREHIKQVLDQSSSFEHAAQILGIDPATLYRKRKKMEQDGCLVMVHPSPAFAGH